MALCAALCASAAARELQAAEAPEASRPVANLIFLVSADQVRCWQAQEDTVLCIPVLTHEICTDARHCVQAVFADAAHLTLQNASSSVQYYGKGEIADSTINHEKKGFGVTSPLQPGQSCCDTAPASCPACTPWPDDDAVQPLSGDCLYDEQVLALV